MSHMGIEKIEYQIIGIIMRWRWYHGWLGKYNIIQLHRMCDIRSKKVTVRILPI